MGSGTTKQKATAALNAMRAIGISKHTAKPVLKNLLKIYDNNWEYIEAENYPVLADAIFEMQESKVGWKKIGDDENGEGKDAASSDGFEFCGESDILVTPSKLNSDLACGSLTKRARLGEDKSSSGHKRGEATSSSWSRNTRVVKPVLPQSSSREVEIQNFSPQVLPENKTTGFVSPQVGYNSERVVQSSIPVNYKGKAILNEANVVASSLPVQRCPSIACKTDKKTLQGKMGNPVLVGRLNVKVGTEYFGTKQRVQKFKEPQLLVSARDTSLSLMMVQSQNSFSVATAQYNTGDISKGEEKVRISIINEISDENYPPHFNYIPRNIVYQNAHVNVSLARIGDEDCCPDCYDDCLAAPLPCACARETGGEFAYTSDGLIRREILDEYISMLTEPNKHHHYYCEECPNERIKNEISPEKCKGHLMKKFVKECWSKCGCSMNCGNRLVQRGITCNLQVFLTSKEKGWGVRTLDKLPRGAFVCEYAGEILTNMELYNRTIQTTGKERHTYPVLLDSDWGSERVLKDEEALCLDATFYGNVARFINHRCFDANLIGIPAEIETPDHHYYHLAFFTTRKVEAYEELTWDYGIDFDDDSHPVEAFRCRCGSRFCRDTRNHRSRAKQKRPAY